MSADHTAFIVVYSHPLFQGCTLIVEGSVADLPLSAQEHLVSTRMREKLRQGLLALGLEVLVRDHVDAMVLHLHGVLQLGVINWACSHRHPYQENA
jgi:hypothetical protein